MLKAEITRLPLQELACESDCRARWPDLTPRQRLVRLEKMALRGELPEQKDGPSRSGLTTLLERWFYEKPQVSMDGLEISFPELTFKDLNQIAERWPDRLPAKAINLVRPWLDAFRAAGCDLAADPGRATYQSEPSRRRGAKTTQIDVARAYLAKHYPNGIPSGVKLETIATQARVSMRTLGRALGRK